MTLDPTWYAPLATLITAIIGGVIAVYTSAPSRTKLLRDLEAYEKFDGMQRRGELFTEEERNDIIALRVRIGAELHSIYTLGRDEARRWFLVTAVVAAVLPIPVQQLSDELGVKLAIAIAGPIAVYIVSDIIHAVKMTGWLGRVVSLRERYEDALEEKADERVSDGEHADEYDDGCEHVPHG